MQVFRRTKKDDNQNRGVEGRVFGAPLLCDRMTKDEMNTNMHQQLTLLARFGLGGCSETPLNEMESDALLRLGHGMAFPDPTYEKWMLEVLEKHFPKAFKDRNDEGDGWDCVSYFLGAHNKEVSSTPTIDSEIKLCLARRAEIVQIANRSEIETPDIRNPILLKSKTGESMRRIGLARFLDRSEEHVFLDFLPQSKLRSHVVVHWSIACAQLE